jgi:Flp pilus assembly protein TadG
VKAILKMNYSRKFQASGVGTNSSGKARSFWQKARRGQAMVEFALIATLVCGVVVGGVQSAIIFNAYLAMSDLTYQGARYAAVNPGYTSDQIKTFMQSIASPVLADNGGANLTISMSPNTTPRAYGQTIAVTVQYSLTNKIVLPNPFLGISFPGSIGFTETAMSE